MSAITYCTGWNSFFKEPAEILNPDRARQLHQERKPYTAIVDHQSGRAVVEMCFFQAYCHVLLLDERERVATRYSFVESTGELLFLEEVAVHYYANDSDRPSHWELFRFKEDGGLLHDTGRGREPITRQEGRTDVSRNYAPVPEFGSYEVLVTRELSR